MDFAAILSAALQIIAQLPQDAAMIKQVIASFNSDDQAALKATLAALQSEADAQHAAAQAL
jgi:hypothetical protein